MHVKTITSSRIVLKPAWQELAGHGMNVHGLEIMSDLLAFAGHCVLRAAGQVRPPVFPAHLPPLLHVPPLVGRLRLYGRRRRRPLHRHQLLHPRRHVLGRSKKISHSLAVPSPVSAVQGVPLGHELGFVDMDFGYSTILPRQ